jgi:hypothetical protein
LGLFGAKERLAVALENLGDFAIGGALDLSIGIQKGHIKQAGKRGPDRRFASPHHSDKHNRLFQVISQKAKSRALTSRRLQWRDLAKNAIYKTIRPRKDAANAQKLRQKGRKYMLRILKLLLVLVVLGFLGLVGFAYLGDLSPNAKDVHQPIVLNIE